MAKKKIFVSFDFAADRALKNEMVSSSQKPDAKYKVSNWSMKPDGNDPKWLKEAKYRITRCDILAVLTGDNTHQAPGVLKEIEIAKAANIKVVQLSAHPQNPPVTSAGTSVDWSDENFNKLLGWNMIFKACYGFRRKMALSQIAGNRIL